MADKKNLTVRQQARAILGVASLSARIAPGAVTFKLLGSFINALLPIATTYYAAKTTTALATAYSGHPNAKHQVITYVIITAVLGLIMTVWSSLDTYVQTKMRYMVETRVSNQMYEHFLALDFWRYDDKDTIDLYDRALKFSQFFSYVFDRISVIISSLISVVSATLALVVVNWVIALFIFVALVPGVYVQFRLSRAQIRHWNENVEGRRMLNMLEWTITQPRFISELRLYNMVNHLLGQRVKLRNADELKRIEIERKTVPLTLLSDALTAGAEVVSLVWISLQVIAGKQPLGQFLYVQQLVSRAMTSASSLISNVSSIDEDIANLFDYEQFMRLPLRNMANQVPVGTLQEIRFDDVSFHYPARKRHNVLRHISLTIKQGQHIAIVGENGAGKSTLVKMLTGLYQPTGGNLLINQIPIQNIDIATWHQQLSVLQQEFIAYNFATARDNVRFGNVDATDDDKRIADALREAEAMDFVEKLPNGVNSYVDNWMEDATGTKGTDLSGGQWQRLALARNFYRNAPIVILDEPTSAIDALAEARIFKRLFTEKNRTIIAISHRLSTIRKADVIYMLKDGEIVETGTHDELIAKKGHFYTMFEDQIKG